MKMEGQTERAGETDCFNYPLAMLPGDSEEKHCACELLI